MEKKQFQAESKRLLEMMVNSIYSQKEIFLRELISNASDAIDKMYYRSLTDENLQFEQDKYAIYVQADKEARTLTLRDTGIGMTKEELEANLGTIAKSGSLAFKKENEIKDGHDIIGQFGVGFYAAFMVADQVAVVSRSVDSDQAYLWQSDGTDGYTIEPAEKDEVGTTITLYLKENGEEESFDEYLEEYRLKQIIKKYSDFIRYPIKMNVTVSKPKEDSEEEYTEFEEEQTLNSMIPIWRKNKSELTDEDYVQFYQDKRYGFDKPLEHIHVAVDGAVRYNAILFIPENTPYDYYSKEFEKGLELYANGVLIMEKSAELVPDYFSFVKGMVDSEDLSLNISREMLQHDRQLQLIAKNIKSKIKSQLKTMLKKDREKYDKFYQAFGRQLKFGVYNDFGANKDDLQDLLLFHSSTENKLVSLADYVSRMKEDQTQIYYATGDSVERIAKLPQTEMVADKGYEILYLTEDVDEFAIKMLREYDGKEFISVSSADLKIDDDEKAEQETSEEDTAMFSKMKEILTGKVKDVRTSKRLKTHPVFLAADGDITIEMEKVLQAMPDNQHVKAEKVLELNGNHDVFASLKQAYGQDDEKFALYTNLLYSQALLIEGLPLEDPVEFTKDMCKVMV
ncbi:MULTISPECIES: molecular chaperone HtpG [Bacillaceae]|uniref:Chaperone protein HtpG n=2 Tax=Bacillaceae TaxID=186817 RepID=A0A9D5DLU3_9BACI|nr:MULTISPECIES: molecular chaperone HtpG [Bacillaceae]KQL56368.1 chaperone protein HtpG [Alkalicoccobacillus plakortidis]MBG9782722.1 chaperone protein HtpG [Shouchella lehensis]TES47658.1 molecular chaperone HtpG [Shouchella lehensis]